MHGTNDHRELDCPEFCNAFEAIHRDVGGYNTDNSEHNDLRSNTAMVFDMLEPILMEHEAVREDVDEIHTFQQQPRNQYLLRNK